MYQSVGENDLYGRLNEITKVPAQIHSLKPYKKFVFKDLCPFMKELCIQASKYHGFKLLDNHVIHVEHKRHVLRRDKKTSHGLAVHYDSDNFGKCYTVLYYYQIDDGILDNYLAFYKLEYPNSFFPCCYNEIEVTRLIPKTGDVITFDGVLHQPGNYKTIEKDPKIRAFVALFIEK